MKKSRLIRSIDAAVLRNATPRQRAAAPGLDDLDRAAAAKGEAIDRAAGYRRHQGGGRTVNRRHRMTGE